MSLANEAPGVGSGSDARHLEALERAISVALSPLEVPNAIRWGDALTAALCALADAPAGAILLPEATPRVQAILRPPGRWAFAYVSQAVRSPPSAFTVTSRSGRCRTI